MQGDFAFAIWDSERRTLFCARDHFGVKPFYYHSTDRRFVFASEIGPILGVDGVSSRISEHQISGFLAGLPDDPQSTPYTDVFRLPARHSLTVTAQQVVLRRYWQIEPSQSPRRSDAAEEFGHLFSQSVRNRMRGTLAVGAMLSGGLDSSSIACVAGMQNAAERKPKLPAFSLIFERGSPMDERPFIDAVLGAHELDGTMIAVGNYAPFAEFDRILEEQEGTFLAPGLSLTRGIYRAARSKGMKVLLDGHGGDEVVSQGHGHLHELANAGKWMELWRELHGASNTYGDGKIGMYYQFLTLYGPAWRLAKLKHVMSRALSKIRRDPVEGRRATSWRGLINPDLAKRTDLVDRFHRAGYMPSTVRVSEALTHRWILSNGIVEHAFEVLDKAAANFGVEPRYPFWDKPLVEFCLALPGEEKLHDGFGRYVLRRAMEGILPPPVQWRRDKIDFKSNLVRGMLGNHRDLLDRVSGIGCEPDRSIRQSAGSDRCLCPDFTATGRSDAPRCPICLALNRPVSLAAASPTSWKPGMMSRNAPLASNMNHGQGHPERRALRERRFYRAYGLTISSDVALPELERAAPAAADVLIRVGPIDLPKPSLAAGAAFRFEPDRQYLAWHAVGAFLITDTRRIDVDPAPGIDDPLIAFPLLGPVMALLLHQRGLLVLHASAIAIGGKSAIFMGDKGAGKSTTAGALVRAGHGLLTDDVVALDLDSSNEPMIIPGFPQIKLAADAAAAIPLKGVEVRPRVHPAIDKIQHRLLGGFSPAKVPATRIYILVRGEEAAISPLRGPAALTAIIKFSYVTRFGRLALAGDFVATHLQQCARLADHVGACRLEVPARLDRIGEAVDLIEMDLASDNRSR